MMKGFAIPLKPIVADHYKGAKIRKRESGEGSTKMRKCKISLKNTTLDELFGHSNIYMESPRTK